MDRDNNAQKTTITMHNANNNNIMRKSNNTQELQLTIYQIYYNNNAQLHQ